MEFKKSSSKPQPRPKSVSAQPIGTLPVRETTHIAPPPAKPTYPKNSPVAKKRRSTEHFLLTKVAAITVGVAIIVGGYFVIQSNTNASDPAKPILDPGYQTVLPNNKSISDLGGWRRVSPPEKEPVYAYADTLDGIGISVSQQPLPNDFKTSTKEHVAELAKKFNATTEVDAGGTPVFIGTSAKGPQSVIMAKKDVLILIKSQQKIDSKSWQRYAASLSGVRY